jgi:hypothetical protein
VYVKLNPDVADPMLLTLLALARILPEICPLIVPPTCRLPSIPTPPSTVNAPLPTDVETVVSVIVTASWNSDVPWNSLAFCTVS